MTHGSVAFDTGMFIDIVGLYYITCLFMYTKHSALDTFNLLVLIRLMITRHRQIFEHSLTLNVHVIALFVLVYAPCSTVNICGNAFCIPWFTPVYQ